MKKIQLLEYIRDAGKDIQDFLAKIREWGHEGLFEHTSLNLHPEYFDFDIELAQKLNINLIHPAYSWLKQIVDTHWKQIQKYWNEQAETRWKRDYAWDHSDHRHMKLVNAEVKKLLAVLRNSNRPDFFKRTKLSEKLKEAGDGAKIR